MFTVGPTFFAPTSQLSAANTGLLNNAESESGGALLSTIGPNLTYFGAASRSTAEYKFGSSSLQTAGGGAYANASSIVMPISGKSFRFEGWFKGTNTFGQFFELRSSASARKIYISSNGAGGTWSYNLASLLGSGGGALFGAVQTVPANGIWYHFAVQKTAGGYIFFFCNGIVVGAVGSNAGEHFADTDLDIVDVGGPSGVAGYFDSLLYRTFTGPAEEALMYPIGDGFSTTYEVPTQAFG